MELKELLDKLRTNFNAQLQEKTNWGRNDVMGRFERAMSDTLAEAANVTDLPKKGKK